LGTHGLERALIDTAKQMNGYVFSSMSRFSAQSASITSSCVANSGNNWARKRMAAAVTAKDRAPFPQAGSRNHRYRQPPAVKTSRTPCPSRRRQGERQGNIFTIWSKKPNMALPRALQAFLYPEERQMQKAGLGKTPGDARGSVSRRG
jgi:hypothetical protein